MLLMNNYKCPYCGEGYYAMGPTISTLVCYPPIYKNGVNINPDRNIHTTQCQCLNCNKHFIVSGNDIDGYEVSK